LAVLQAAEARYRHRQQQNAMNFQLPEAKIQVQQPFTMESSVVVQPSAPQQTESCPSQLLVSEMMILAGQAIARLGQLAASSGTHCLYKFIFFISVTLEKRRLFILISW